MQASNANYLLIRFALNEYKIQYKYKAQDMVCKD